MTYAGYSGALGADEVSAWAFVVALLLGVLLHDVATAVSRRLRR